MMVSYADISRKPNYPEVAQFSLPLYDNYFFEHFDHLVWGSSYLTAIVKVIAYINPQTQIDFARLELSESQMKVVEIAKEIRRRRELTRRHHKFGYDMKSDIYKREMEKLKEDMDFLKEIEPMFVDIPESTLCPACEQIMEAGNPMLQLPDSSYCCHWDCYAVILSREHANGH